MTSFEADRLHASDTLRETCADRMAQVFDLHLRSASPSLANAVAAAMPAGEATEVVAVIVAAIIEIAERNKNGHAVAAFDALRQAGRAAPRNDAVMGHALIAALTDVLGSSFDEPVRDAWANGYIRLVEAVMASRRNRMDFVA